MLQCCREWKGLEKLCDEELHYMYPLPDVIMMLKLGRLRYGGMSHVPHMGEMANTHYTQNCNRHTLKE